MNVRAALLLASFIGWSPTAAAIDPNRPFDSLTVRTWGEAQGLPQPRVRAIAESADGYLWLGTEAGLVRFDGDRFTLFRSADTGGALSAPQVAALLVDRTGRLWIGSHGGPAAVWFKDNAFHSLRGKADARGSAAVTLFETREGATWLGSWTGAVRHAEDRWTSFGPTEGVPAAPVYAFAQAADGTLWTGTLRGLARWRGERAESVTIPEMAPDAPVRALAFDRSGALWIGTIDAGLFRFDGHRTRRFGIGEGLPHIHVEALLVDRSGAVWVGTRGGLARVIGDRVERPPAQRPELATPIEALFEDRAGGLWAGSAVDGLIHLTAGPVTMLNDGRPPAPLIAVAVGPDGSWWLAPRNDGLVRVRGRETRHWRTTEGLCGDFVTALLPAGDAVWIGTSTNRSTLCRLRGDRFTSFGEADGLPPQTVVRSIVQDPGGAIVVGGDGLFRYANDRFTPVPLPATQRIDSQTVFGLHRARGGDWWLGLGDALYRGRLGDWRRVAPLMVTSLVERGDDVWLGSFDGLFRLTPDGVHASSLNERPVHAVIDDGKGHLWVASPSGLWRIPLTASGSRATRRFGLSDGLATNQLTSHETAYAAARTPDGRLLFTTAKGLAVVDPARVPDARPAPAAIVEDLRADGRTIAVRAAIDLPAGRGDLEVRYTAPAPARADGLAFRYRLDPFDRDWVNAGSRRFAAYTALPPGQYAFRVAALDEDGRAGPESVPITLRWAPHWYQTLVFRTALGLAALAMLVAAHRTRLRRAEAKHRAVVAERTRIAREIHDTLAQELTGISLHLEAASHRLTTAPDRARQSVDQARALVRLGLAEARSVAWDLRPEVLRRVGLPAALAELVRQLSAEIPIRLQVDGAASDLSESVETALLRTAQEALANALRHGNPRHVVVTLAFGATAVTLSIVDDGTGFDAASAPRDRGLEGIRQRVTDAGGRLDVRSSAGSGTEVRASLPLAARARNA